MDVQRQLKAAIVQEAMARTGRLPDARILYVSATGATTPENLAYAARLGLWGGPDAPFPTREAFMDAVETGGVAVMELIARELKAMGLYIARSLLLTAIVVLAITVAEVARRLDVVLSRAKGCCEAWSKTAGGGATSRRAAWRAER